jgi:intein-encoded DNA endonuclease-like protein
MSDKKIVKAFLSLERLDKKWTIRLKSIKGKPLVKNTEEQLSLCCEQFIVNGLYRHLSDAEDTMWVRAKTITCVLFWYIILSILEEEQNQNVQDFTLVSDIVRALSAEVEYSEKNLDKIYSFSFEFIEI